MNHLIQQLIVAIITITILTGCKRNAVVFAPPPKGGVAAGILSASSSGIDSNALNSIEYAFLDFSGISITKYHELGGSLTAVRMEGSVSDREKFMKTLSSLKKNKKLYGLKIYFLDENSSNPIEVIAGKKLETEH